MWKKVAIGVVGALAVFVAVVATRPSEFRIQRSLVMSAPPEVVFGLIDDFHAWGDWSPWEKPDPAMKKTFSGAESGVGATYAWSGNDRVGVGEMTITESRPPKSVDLALKFEEPWEAQNTTRFTIASQNQGVDVTWAMEGQNDFAGKAMGLVMDMDALLGADFEKGLLAMKQVAEAKAAELDEKQASEDAARAAEAAAAKAKAEAEAAAMEDADLPPP
jgi:hypothetical protein